MGAKKGRKPEPEWTIIDVVKLFESKPGWRMTQRDLQRAVNATRSRDAYNKIALHILYANDPASAARFRVEQDPSNSRRVWIVMVDRGY